MPGGKYTQLTKSSSTRDYVADPLIAPLLRVPLQAIRARVHAAVSAAGFDDLGPAHLNILQAPTPDGVRPSDLAARGQMTKQAANRLIRHLERRGYLRLEPDPTDQRARIVRLTERGWQLIATIRATVEEIEREWSRRIGASRFKELRRTLADLSERDS